MLLRGKLVRLCPRERDHLPTFVRWFNDPDVTQYLLWFLPLSLAKEETWFEKMQDNDKEVGFSIIAIDDNANDIKLIGSCSARLEYKDRHATVGIMIGEKDCWGKGYGTEAMGLLIEYCFDVLNMHKVELETFATNARAMSSYRKCGFKEEGKRREAHFNNGQYIDVVQFGLLDREWRAARASDGS